MLTVLSPHSVWFMSMLSIILPFSHSFIEPISSTSPPHPNQSEHHPSLNIHLHHQQHLKRRESRPRFCHCWDSIRVQSPNTLINFSISENHVQFFQVISPYWINVTSKAPNKHKTQQMKKKIYWRLELAERSQSTLNWVRVKTWIRKFWIKYKL